MTLFIFNRKKEKNDPASSCRVENIKVLGTGCKTCHQQFENVKKAVQNLGLPVAVEYITDLAQVQKYGVMMMPALVVDEKVASSGKLLNASQVEKLLKGGKQ